MRNQCWSTLLYLSCLSMSMLLFISILLCPVVMLKVQGPLRNWLSSNQSALNIAISRLKKLWCRMRISWEWLHSEILIWHEKLIFKIRISWEWLHSEILIWHEKLIFKIRISWAYLHLYNTGWIVRGQSVFQRILDLQHHLLDTEKLKYTII